MENNNSGTNGNNNANNDNNANNNTNNNNENKEQYAKRTKELRMKTRLFPYINDISLIDKLKIDADSIHYISVREVADKITKIIKTYSKDKDAIITDATAGVGG